MGYTALMMLHVFSRRVVHRAELQSNLKVLDLTFFNAFWVLLGASVETTDSVVPHFRVPVPSEIVRWLHSLRADQHGQDLDKPGQE